ncbi:rRNA maturation RNase YbeY [Glaciecola sp. MF2-115]|uniref:rRNA maturation RNase YbeY n=1 Tax=Glaciecola sp. MF2-115 TaxID=3384827 RepID=UPI0039A0D7D5
MKVDLQNVLEQDKLNHVLPSNEQIEQWFNRTIEELRSISEALSVQQSDSKELDTVRIQQQTYELTLRIVDSEESQQLNADYRDKNKPTNVLSFPFEAPEHIDMPFLGDLVVCAALVEKEANEQNKLTINHWAHLCIHGLLHLLGYDHIEESEAQEMEGIETAILARFNIDDPYQYHSTL